MNFTIHYTNVGQSITPIKERAGYGIHSAENCTISSGERILISTGIRIDMPRGFHGKIEGRIKLSKIGIDCASSTIDSSDVITVLLINNGKEPFHLKKGDDIALLVIQPHWWGCLSH